MDYFKLSLFKQKSVTVCDVAVVVTVIFRAEIQTLLTFISRISFHESRSVYYSLANKTEYYHNLVLKFVFIFSFNTLQKSIPINKTLKIRL